MPFFYTVCNLTMKALLLLLSDWEVEGKENVPPSGPLIVVANHLNLPDPPLLTASIPRRIIFMAKEELFRSRGGPFVRWFGAFPVRRGELDREAIRQAMEILDAGLALGMFPEGRRSPNSGLIQAEPGTALIALRSQAHRSALPGPHPPGGHKRDGEGKRPGHPSPPAEDKGKHRAALHPPL